VGVACGMRGNVAVARDEEVQRGIGAQSLFCVVSGWLCSRPLPCRCVSMANRVPLMIFQSRVVVSS